MQGAESQGEYGNVHLRGHYRSQAGPNADAAVWLQVNLTRLQ